MSGYTFDRPIGRCIGCFHDFTTGPCGGCGAIPGPEEQCPGDCDDECAKCSSPEPLLWCDDCRAYSDPIQAGGDQ